MNNILQVGAVTSTHGLAGEVKVFPTTDDPKRFKKLKQVLLDTGKDMLPLGVEHVKFFKNMVILKFKGYDRIEDIMGFKGKNLYVTRENAVRLKKDEYFIADLIGMKVYTEDEAYLGELTEVITTGANDVYTVHMENGKDVLIPAIGQCILNELLCHDFVSGDDRERDAYEHYRTRDGERAAYAPDDQYQGLFNTRRRTYR